MLRHKMPTQAKIAEHLQSIDIVGKLAAFLQPKLEALNKTGSSDADNLQSKFAGNILEAHSPCFFL